MADPGDDDDLTELEVDVDLDAGHLDVEALIDAEQELLSVDVGESDEVDVLAAEEQDLPGPKGDPGPEGPRGAAGRDGAPGGALSRTAVAPVAALHVVVAVDAGQVRELQSADPDDAERILGVARSSAVAGEDLEVVRLGLLQSSAWSFAVGQPVFCGLWGELTQAPDAQGMAFWARMGVAVAADAVFIDPQPPLYL